MTTSKNFSLSSAVPDNAMTSALGAVADDGAGVAVNANSGSAANAREKARDKSGKTKRKAAADTSSNQKTKLRAASETKADVVLKKLRLAKGATLTQLAEATGWQPHSVRGFLSGTVRKKLGLKLASDIGKDGVRRYRIDDTAAEA
ncbi:DUF3489 domain-containing protein [Aminobacter sp. SS-2016]|uniref:DUF3489 domain-containing protein n=1 Tax=Aminobacter sp. Y103A TaxID=1870862 RepID=UPI0025743930|nr:DUF3489 domain-containing protein [Aminobacter sp. SS-2016]